MTLENKKMNKQKQHQQQSEKLWFTIKTQTQEGKSIFATAKTEVGSYLT